MSTILNLHMCYFIWFFSGCSVVQLGINRLISNGMSSIYLKVTIEKHWCPQNFDFISLENLSPRRFFGSSNSRRYHEILKLLIPTQKSESASKIILISEGNIMFLDKNINFNKTKRYWKRKILHTVLERRTLCFSSYKNRKLKVKLWWVGACERKRGYFLYLLFCPKEIF